MRARNFRVRFDLEVHAFECDGGVELFWLYNRDLFDRWRVEQMARHYANAAGGDGGGARRAAAPAGDPGRGERQTLLEGFNATARPVPEATLPAAVRGPGGAHARGRGADLRGPRS